MVESVPASSFLVACDTCIVSTGEATMPISLRLPPDVEDRLTHLAKVTGRSKTYYATQAIREHLDDLEDLYLAEKELEDVRAGRSLTFTLDEVERELGLAD